MIKLLVVDDSALMRRQLTQVFEATGDFEIRIARNGQEAIDENQAWQPDVVTLDINMPVMDGITALSHMMETRPVPVVMVSSLTEKGALATFEALALGAVDYIAKPGGTISLSIEEIQDVLVGKVRAAARARLRTTTTRNLTEKLRSDREAHARSVRQNFVRKPAPGGDPEGLVLIGVSTGGPSTLEEILPKLPADFPLPVIVAQHMPGSFTGPFAQRMNNQCELEVLEVSRPMPLEVGHVYVGKGGADVVVATRGDKLMVMPRPEDPKHLWHPSVDVLAQSVLTHCEASQVIAVMLTGMGYDGAEGFKNLHQQGARTIAESEDSAVVFGMPRELIERGGAGVVLPANRIASQLISWVNG